MTPSTLQTILDSGACEESNRIGVRIVAALEDLRRSNGHDWADLVVLVRQALENWSLNDMAGRRGDAVVRVSGRKPWPSAEQWALADVTADALDGDRLRLNCNAWSPDWLPKSDCRAVEDACAAQLRRPPQHVRNDPLVMHRMGHPNATSAGQRDAVRSVYLTPPGSNLLVVLPTGAGKSTVFQFAALHNAATGTGLVVVVVPTTALALDQEARFRELAARAGQALPEGVAIAFHAGLSPEERRALAGAVRDGSIPIVFASPEALLGALQRPLLDAADAGLISTFAIDEAHMVAQWSEFRPQFQAISGFRDALRDRCPSGHAFRTVLLTATLTEEGFDVLRNVFGELRVVAEVALRTEPAYSLAVSKDDAEKRGRIKEALYHLPRPLILYTTRRDDAKEWYERMVGELGFHRVRLVLGGHMSEERGAEVLRAWNAGHIDVVVATSAFGLGVDQSEVRSVLHACVPESLDRWYQEVGRGGRDGHASVALLIADADDMGTAEGMAKERLLHGSTAWDRWSAMRSAPRPAEFADGNTPRSILSVPLDLPAANNDVATWRDELWNLRTITMMVQAGLLRFAHALPTEVETTMGVDDGVSIAVSGAERPRARPYAHVAILDTDHLDRDKFILRLEAARARSVAGNEQDVARLRMLLAGTKSVHELLREAYRIAQAGVSVPTTSGDCPRSRHEHRADHQRGSPRLVRPDRATNDEVGDLLRKLFDERPPHDQGPLIVSYESSGGWAFEDDMERLAERLAALGLIEFAWPKTGCRTLNWAKLAERAPGRYVFAADPEDDPTMDPWWVPRLTVLFAPDEGQLRQTLAVQRPRHLLVVPTGLRDPHNPHRSFDQTRVHCTLPTFVERIRLR